MSQIRFEQKWIEQCAGARRVREHFGLAAALDYLISEKLFTFAEVAELSTEFMQELPDFLPGNARRLPAGRNSEYASELEQTRPLSPPSA